MAVSSAKSKAARRASKLYFASKISDYRFRKLLWRFVLDEPASEVARQMRISVNSVNAIYGKIRAYFAKVGLFEDFYSLFSQAEADQDPALLRTEFAVLDFHLARMRTKRGVSNDDQASVLQFRESYWRFNALLYTDPDNARRMMYADLLAIIRICGPIGREPENLREARIYMVERIDQRAAALERNSPEFRTPESRAKLRDIRS